MEKNPDAAAAAAPAAAGDKKQDFEGAFSEFAKGKSTESAPSPADAGAAAASGEPKAGDPPAAVVPDKPAAAGEPAAGAPAAAAATEDPWKDAPQPLREAHEKAIAEEKRARDAAEQKAKSAEGRYKAANSKLADLERHRAPAPAASAAAASAAPAAAAAAKPAAAAPGSDAKLGAAADPKGPQMPPEWSQLVETLPDVAKAVEARFGAVDEAMRAALAAVKPVQEAEAARFGREQATLLDGAYPGWDKAVQSPEFKTWITQQPHAVRELAKSDYAADNAALLEYYGYQPPKPNPEPAAAPAAPSGGKTAAEIAAERDARLARSTSVRGSGAQPLANAPDNFEQAFSFYARQRQEGNARRA